MTISTNGGSLHLNWEHVFGLSKDIPTTFDVTVGTGEGYSDLFDTYSLTSNSCSFEVTDISIITGHFKEVYITVSSVYATGRRAIYKTKHNLKP